MIASSFMAARRFVLAATLVALPAALALPGCGGTAQAMEFRAGASTLADAGTSGLEASVMAVSLGSRRSVRVGVAVGRKKEVVPNRGSVGVGRLRMF